MEKLEQRQTEPTRQTHEKAQKSVRVEQVDLKIQNERRARRIAEFKKDFKDNPIGGIMTIIDILPANLDILLAKHRLGLAEKKLTKLEGESYDEASELNKKHEKLKMEVVEAEENLKGTLQKLVDFETGSLEVSGKMSKSEEAN